MRYRPAFLIVAALLSSCPDGLGQEVSATPKAAAAAVPVTLGAITGTVIESGTQQPVGLAVVTAERQPDPRPKGRAAQNIVVSSRTARTGVDGVYTIPNLPAGTYEVCVSAQHAQWLNPCHWSNVTPTANVKDEKTTNNAPIRLEKGAILKLRIEDGGGDTVKSANTVPGTELMIGPRNKHGFVQRPRMTSRDASGINYEILVPMGEAVPLFVVGKSYRLADSNGKSVGLADDDFIVTIPKDAKEQSVKVTVLGRKQ